MADKFLSISRRTRQTPFTPRVESAGVQGYTVYNHMLLPTFFESSEADYWSLCEDVQVWDVSCERQIEVSGPDSERLIQLMTPRDISKAVVGQGLYAPLCDENGNVVNDPVLIKFAPDNWWISIADSDVRLWARGLAFGFGLDVEIREAAVWPLAVQGPKAQELVTRVFGDEVSGIEFFRSKMLEFHGKPMMVMRSGYSKQGGFEIYLNDPELALPLWDDLFAKGADLRVRAGGPNLIERIESGLLSYGNDMNFTHNPFECGLDAFIDLDADIESMSLPALRTIKGKHLHQLVGIVFDEAVEFDDFKIEVNGKVVGDVRSQVWSPRYRRFLTMVMMKREFLSANTNVNINGKLGKIVDLPFDFDAIV
ncbi:MAG: dimethylsulfoniopropionate demethylase [Gammaproteobacteria bacterium]|nr:dimethylsulfoniopropionate demethylase [Gammaproteobacteria bacterium]